MTLSSDEEENVSTPDSHTRSMSIRWDEELMERLDARDARHGDRPPVRWLRRAIEEKLELETLRVSQEQQLRQDERNA